MEQNPSNPNPAPRKPPQPGVPPPPPAQKPVHPHPRALTPQEIAARAHGAGKPHPLSPAVPSAPTPKPAPAKQAAPIAAPQKPAAPRAPVQNPAVQNPVQPPAPQNQIASKPNIQMPPAAPAASNVAAPKLARVHLPAPLAPREAHMGAASAPEVIHGPPVARATSSVLSPTPEETQPTNLPLSEKTTLAWWITIAVALLFTLSLFVPWNPTLPAGELDGSWCMALHWAFLQGVDFGHDLIFTFGPWGFIWQGYNPSTIGFEIAGWLLISGAFFAGIVKLARHFTGTWWVAGIWMFGVIALAGASPTLQDVRLFALGALLLLVHFYVDDRPMTVAKGLLTTALALATLVKFSMAFIALAAVLAITIEQIRRKRVPWIGILYLIGVLIFWLAARQHLGSLPAYVYHSWLITSGFAAGQIQVQPKTEARDVVMYALCALILLGVVVYSHRLAKQRLATQSLWGIPAIIGALLLMFVAFKAGYVRHDGHEMAATTFLATLSLLYLAALWPTLQRTADRLAMPIAAVLCLLLARHSYAVFSPEGLPATMLSGLARSPVGLKSAVLLLSGNSKVRSDYQASLELIRNEMPLANLKGTIDIYPWEQRVLLANGLQYRPRPVIQSYLAYDPVLGRINADFLRSDGAPDLVLFDIARIDGRYPSQNDALSWPELLTRYDLIDNSRRLILLKKSAAPRPLKVEPLISAVASLGETVAVPDDVDPIWVDIDLKIKPLGRLLSALYKPPFVRLNVTTVNGTVVPFQLIPEIARAGFLLSPMVVNREIFSNLTFLQWKTMSRDAIVTQIAVQTVDDGGDSAFYENKYSVHFSRLHYPQRDAAVIARQRPQLSQMVQLLQHANFDPPDAHVQMTKTTDGQELLAMAGTTRFVIPVPKGATKLRVNFGMLPTAAAAGATSQSDAATQPADAPRPGTALFGVYVIVKAENGIVVANPIWSRTLDPINVEQDRGTQTSYDIVLPSPAPQSLVIGATSGNPPNPARPDMYWTAIEFR